MNPEKKISFSFNKLGKKPVSINKPQEKKVDYIVCLEESSIKLKHEPKEIDKGPLIIPLKDNQKDLLDRVRHMKAKQINITKIDNVKAEDTRPDSELTIEELATREVIRDAQLKLQENVTKDNKTFVVPLKKDEVAFDGEKESTLTDYENIPVNDFGLAMLRGMGWKEGTGIGKNPSKAAVKQVPELRPKGLGLGANPACSDKQQPVCDKDGQALILKRGSYAKVVAGSQKGTYCEVQGLDDEAGRVVVKTSLKGEILTFNEFMLVPITKEEYSKNSKVINSAKFEEYKEMEKIKIKAEIKSEKNDEYFSNSKDNNKNYNAQVKSERSHSSDEADSKDTKSRDRSKKYNDSSDLDSDDRRSRRIHKRKDKRRHRDKSRSPSRSKHGSHRKSSKSKYRYKSSSDSDCERKSKSRNRNSSNSDDDRYKRRNKR